MSTDREHSPDPGSAGTDDEPHGPAAPDRATPEETSVGDARRPKTLEHETVGDARRPEREADGSRERPGGDGSAAGLRATSSSTSTSEGAGRGELLRLLALARGQLGAAQTLICQGCEAEAASLLWRGWHALATLRAFERGEGAPAADAFEPLLDSELLGLRSRGQRGDWAETFPRLRDLALRPPAEAARTPLPSRARALARRRTVERQFELLHRAVRGNTRRLGFARTLLRRLLGALPRPTPVAGVAPDAAANDTTDPTEAPAPRGLRGLLRRPALRWGALLALLLGLTAWGLSHLDTLVRPKTAPTRRGPPVVRDVSMPGGHIQPPRDTATLADLSTPKAPGTYWNAAGNVTFSERLTIDLGKVRHPRALEISLDNNDTYRLVLRKGEQEVSTLTLGPTLDQGGLVVYRKALPDEVQQAGVDTIVVTAVAGDPARAVGHLTLDPPAAGR